MNQSDSALEFYRQLYKEGYIRDEKYINILAGQQSYMDYLKENPQLLLTKRIEWKINKLIGMTSMKHIVANERTFMRYTPENQEIYEPIRDWLEYEKQEFHKSRQDFDFFTFEDVTKAKDLIGLLCESLHIDVRKLSNNLLLDIVYLLDAYGVDKWKIVFFLLRANSHISTSIFRTRLLSNISTKYLLTIKLTLEDMLDNIVSLDRAIPNEVTKERFKESILTITESLSISKIKEQLTVDEDKTHILFIAGLVDREGAYNRAIELENSIKRLLLIRIRKEEELKGNSETVHLAKEYSEKIERTKQCLRDVTTYDIDYVKPPKVVCKTNAIQALLNYNEDDPRTEHQKAVSARRGLQNILDYTSKK